MKSSNKLPLRIGVGIVLLNEKNNIFVNFKSNSPVINIKEIISIKREIF